MADLKPKHLAVLAAIGAAGVLFYTATRSVGPVQSESTHRATEQESPAQDFQDHLAHAGELLTAPVMVPHRYPAQTCPGTTQTMHQGFAPHYAISDPQVAALPAEEAW